MFRSILLPVDLTNRHQPCLDAAVELASQSKGKIVVLHVIETIPGLPMEEEKDFYGRLEKAARRHLERLGGRLNDHTVPWRGEVLYGIRSLEIIKYAGTIAADIIILTAPRIDKNNLGAGWGSLSFKISVLAPCPVLLVR